MSKLFCKYVSCCCLDDPATGEILQVSRLFCASRSKYIDGKKTGWSIVCICDLLPQQHVPAMSTQTDTSVAVLTVREEQATPGIRLGRGSATVPLGHVPAKL